MVTHMQLTERNRAIIRHQFLTFHQIIALVGDSVRRLQLLFHLRYLKRSRAQLQYYVSHKMLKILDMVRKWA